MYITDMSALYELTGQVTYRMTYNHSAHIRVRCGIYRFVRRVPADLQKIDAPALHLVIVDEADGPETSPTMIQAVEIYLRLKAEFPAAQPPPTINHGTSPTEIPRLA